MPTNVSLKSLSLRYEPEYKTGLHYKKHLNCMRRDVTFDLDVFFPHIPFDISYGHSISDTEQQKVSMCGESSRIPLQAMLCLFSSVVSLYLENTNILLNIRPSEISNFTNIFLSNTTKIFVASDVIRTHLFDFHGNSLEYVDLSLTDFLRIHGPFQNLSVLILGGKQLKYYDSLYYVYKWPKLASLNLA